MSAAPLIQFPRAAMKDLVKDITDAQVVWDVEPETLVGISNNKPGYWIQLSVVGNEELGVDNVRPVYDTVNQVNDVTQISWRIITLRFRVTSLSLQVAAFDVMDQIKRGLRSLSAKEGYQDIGISLATWGKTVDTTPPSDNRTTTQAVLDVRFNWQISSDPADDDGGVILSVATFTNQVVP